MPPWPEQTPGKKFDYRTPPTLHEALLASAYRTVDPTEADLFYVPTWDWHGSWGNPEVYYRAHRYALTLHDRPRQRVPPCPTVSGLLRPSRHLSDGLRPSPTFAQVYLNILPILECLRWGRPHVGDSARRGSVRHAVGLDARGAQDVNPPEQLVSRPLLLTPLGPPPSPPPFPWSS